MNDAAEDLRNDTDNDIVRADELRTLIARIERLNKEVDNLKEDIKVIYSEAKQQGYEVKVIRKIVAMRKRDILDIQKEELLMELYKRALGMDI
jgi:uncharacterized protein (UPF0335 family)